MRLVVTLNVIANYSNLQIVNILITFVNVEDTQLKLQRYQMNIIQIDIISVEYYGLYSSKTIWYT